MNTLPPLTLDTDTYCLYKMLGMIRSFFSSSISRLILYSVAWQPRFYCDCHSQRCFTQGLYTSPCFSGTENSSSMTTRIRLRLLSAHPTLLQISVFFNLNGLINGAARWCNGYLFTEKKVSGVKSVSSPFCPVCRHAFVREVNPASHPKAARIKMQHAAVPKMTFPSLVWPLFRLSLLWEKTKALLVTVSSAPGALFSFCLSMHPLSFCCSH